METWHKETRRRLCTLGAGPAALGILLGLAPAASLHGQDAPAASAATPTAAAQPSSPPRNPGFFPLSQVRRGLIGTAWTVFEGTQPEPMQVEILGVLRGARGPGQDMILARLLGAKPEYTGVVEGMSGSPVYIGDKLLGSLSYRIGQFSKEPIAGITPIEQMLEVRDLPIEADGGLQTATSPAGQTPGASGPALDTTSDPSTLTEPAALIEPMDTPLAMSGFSPAAIQFWREHVSGAGLESVAAGGMGTSEAASPVSSAAARASLEPGSAISALLVRGDVEISATCTVTYMDPKQLLACGHPVLQAGPVSLPMTTAEVITTLASPLNAFKIINTGTTVGAFTQDRDSAIRGVLGATARMIPMHIAVDGPGGPRKVNVEILDLPSLTVQAMEVVLYESLLEANASTESTSYHLTGSIDLEDFPSVPIDVWASGGESTAAPLRLALLAGERFAALYSNGARQGTVRGIELHVETVPRRVDVELEAARLVSGDIVHAGDTVEVEATLRPWQQPERNVRIAIKLPDRLDGGNLRLLVSDAATLDRTLNQPRRRGGPANLTAVLDEARRQHSADRIYIALLMPEAQAAWDGETLSAVPLSMANALEPLRTAEDISLNGESVVVAGEAPAAGVLSGFKVLNLHIDPGGGLN